MARLPFIACVSVVLIACFIFFFQLSAKPFWDYDEALYANVIQDTLKSGDILTLKAGSGPYFDKPPLSFWLSMGFDSVFHNPEFSYRLTAALASIASIVLVMLITYEVTGSLFIAAIAGAILVTIGPFIQAGRELRLDVPAVAMILLSVYAFLRGMRSPVWFLGIGIGLALGFMFKSVIGLLSVPFFFIWSAYNRDISWIKISYLWLGALLFLAILVPWHIYEIAQYGVIFWNAFSTILGHVSGDTLGGSFSSRDYVAFFLTYAAPWTTVFAIIVAWLVFSFKKYRTENFRDLFIFTTVALFLFVFFLISKTKILTYLLPIYPFVAISIALTISYWLDELKDNTVAYNSIMTLFVALLAFALWVGINFGFHIFPYVARNDVIVKEEKEVADMIVQQPLALDLYSYQYNYYDTIEYYSGRRHILAMQDDQALDRSFLLLVGKEYMDWHQFPPELQVHLDTLYKGQSLILYKFNP